MSKVLKISFVAAVIAFFVPVFMTAMFSELSTILFGITLAIPLILVLGVYSAVKERLLNELNGNYDRRPLFKAGITVSVLLALFHSFGVMLNEVVHVDKLYEEREKTSIAGIQEANDEYARLEAMEDRSADSDSTMVRIQEYVAKETKAMDDAKEHKGEVHVDLTSL